MAVETPVDHYKLLRPEVCEHGVDQRVHSFAENGMHGFRQDWCRQCLAKIDVAAALAFFRTLN